MKEIAQTEKEMRETKDKHPKSAKELSSYINSLVSREHEYGTCVYAMSLAAVAAFNYVAHKLGVTGFQANCADLDVIRRTRGMKHGFRIIDYNDLLYPQYLTSERFPDAIQLINNEKEQLSKAAKAKLLEDKKSISGAHPNVKAWWEYLASLS